MRNVLTVKRPFILHSINSYLFSPQSVNALAFGSTMTMVITSHVKDVDRPKPVHRRPTGEIISPLSYTNDLVDL